MVNWPLFSNLCSWLGNNTLLSAYTYSILVFAVLSAAPITLILYIISNKDLSECRGFYPFLLGVLERALFIILVASGLHYVLLGWLAVKGLQSPFSRIKDAERCNPEFLNTISDNYHLLLIGNCLSLLSGVIGGLLVKPLCPSLWN